MTQVNGCFPENIESGKHVPIIPNPFTLKIHNTRMASLWKREKANIIGKGKQKAKELMPYNVVLEKTSESPLHSQEIKPVNLKGNQPWVLAGKTDAEAEAPVVWSPDANSRLIGKVPDAGEDGRQKEKRASEDEMAGWQHRGNGHELGQTQGDGEGQGGGRPGVLQSRGFAKSRPRLGERPAAV